MITPREEIIIKFTERLKHISESIVIYDKEKKEHIQEYNQSPIKKKKPNQLDSNCYLEEDSSTMSYLNSLL